VIVKSIYFGLLDPWGKFSNYLIFGPLTF